MVFYYETKRRHLSVFLVAHVKDEAPDEYVNEQRIRADQTAAEVS